MTTLLKRRKLLGLPKKKSTPGKGRSTKEDQLRYEKEKTLFINYIVKIYSKLDLDVSLRGWAYLLETNGLIDKSEFDKAESLITELRKDGDLPLNITLPDEDRVFTDYDWCRRVDPGVFAYGQFSGFEDARSDFEKSYKGYKGISFWDEQEVFVMMMVEKGDLKRLFDPICRKYRIPIATGKGWYDLHQRWAAAQKFKEYEGRGKQPILLYCGDHDPDGLKISEVIMENFEAIQDCWKIDENGDKETGWNPENLIIDRFGLNADFIDEAGLTWLDNLATSSGGYYAEVIDGQIVQGKLKSGKPHPGFYYANVQEYLRLHGVNKCEANAIVVNSRLGRQLGLKSIKQYVSRKGIVNYWKRIGEGRKDAKEVIERMLEDYDEET